MFERANSLLRCLLFGRFLHAIDGPALGAEERRVWLRHAADVATRCGPTNPRPRGVAFAARIVDISLAGARIVTGQAFREGALMSIELPPAAGRSTLAVLAIVVHASAAEDGVWTLGCRFSRPLEGDALRAFGVTRGVPMPEPEAMPSLSAVYRLAAPHDPAPRPADVVHLGCGGASLRTDRAVPVGVMLTLTLRGPSGRPLPDLLACVVHAAAEPDGSHLLGCDFIRELSDDELTQLVQGENAER